MPASSSFAAPASLDVVIDRLLVGRCEHDAVGDVARLVDGVADDAVVEHGLVDRDRKRLVRAEADGVRKLALVVDAVDVERAHADAVRPDAEADAAARQLVVGEEPVERRRERRDVAHLAGDDDARLERLARELDELRLRAAVVDDARGGDLRGADLETDDLLLPRAASASSGRRFRRAGLPWLLRPPDEVRQPDLLVQVHVLLHLRGEPQGRSVGELLSGRGRRFGSAAKSGRFVRPERSSRPRSWSGRDERAKAVSAVTTRRRTRSASDCSIVSIPRDVLVCMTE